MDPERMDPKPMARLRIDYNRRVPPYPHHRKVMPMNPHTIMRPTTFRRVLRSVTIALIATGWMTTACSIHRLHADTVAKPQPAPGEPSQSDPAETKPAPKKPGNAKPNNKKPNKKKPANPAMTLPNVDPALPNVLIVGDSISIGYTVATREALAGVANVYRPLTNCGPTTRGLASLENWIGDTRWDVIHFNFGLHDLKYMGPQGQNLADPKANDSQVQVSINDYEANIETIARRLKATGAKVIWRETSPIPEGARGRLVEQSQQYNAAAKRAIDRVGGIEVDPFYEFAIQHAEHQRKADVHYTPEGSRLLGEHVAEVIRKSLERVVKAST